MKFRYDQPVPEFVDRFGLAYQAELAHFVDCCLLDKPFGVDQNDGLAAMEVIDAAVGSLLRPERATPIKG
ncbi:Inositol 2-dehydrogenase/D-chiro-inositol 3-dehydrogenase [compost metagenome]